MADVSNTDHLALTMFKCWASFMILPLSLLSLMMQRNHCTGLWSVPQVKHTNVFMFVSANSNMQLGLVKEFHLIQTGEIWIFKLHLHLLNLKYNSWSVPLIEHMWPDLEIEDILHSEISYSCCSLISRNFLAQILHITWNILAVWLFKYVWKLKCSLRIEVVFGLSSSTTVKLHSKKEATLTHPPSLPTPLQQNGLSNSLQCESHVNCQRVDESLWASQPSQDEMF